MAQARTPALHGLTTSHRQVWGPHRSAPACPTQTQQWCLARASVGPDRRRGGGSLARSSQTMVAGCNLYHHSAGNPCADLFLQHDRAAADWGAWPVRLLKGLRQRKCDLADFVCGLPGPPSNRQHSNRGEPFPWAQGTRLHLKNAIRLETPEPFSVTRRTLWQAWSLIPSVLVAGLPQICAGVASSGPPFPPAWELSHR